MQSLQNILGSFIREYGLEGGVVLGAIRRRWTDIVGSAISVHTYADTMKGRVITIIVDTPQWLHHLSFFKKEILEKLKHYSVDDIRFRIGRIPEEEKDPVVAGNAELSDDDRRYVENTLRNIKDEELKETFRKLIMHGLLRSRKKE